MAKHTKTRLKPRTPEQERGEAKRMDISVFELRRRRALALAHKESEPPQSDEQRREIMRDNF